MTQEDKYFYWGLAIGMAVMLLLFILFKRCPELTCDKILALQNLCP